YPPCQRRMGLSARIRAGCKPIVTLGRQLLLRQVPLSSNRSTVPNSWQNLEAEGSEVRTAFNLHLSEKTNKARLQRTNLKLQLRSAARSRIQDRGSFGMQVHHRLVVLIESDEMREGGHKRLQLREAFAVRRRDP